MVKGGSTSIARKVSHINLSKLHLNTNFSDQNLTNLGPFNIEVFSSEELLVNITYHELVPKHQTLSDLEKIELLKR